MSISALGEVLTVTLHWFGDSPAAGSWRCVCSLCGEVIGPKDGPPLRVWRMSTGEEARLHRACFALLREPPVACVEPFTHLIEDAP